MNESQRVTPTDWEVPIFPVPMIPLPGRVFVIMAPPRLKSDGGIYLEGQDCAIGSKHQPDYGVVVDLMYSPNHGLTPDRLKVDDKVFVKPFDGAWLTHRECDWIPEGRQLRIYPTPGDTWRDGIECILED